MKSKLGQPLARLSFAVALFMGMLPLAASDAGAQIVTDADRCREDLAQGSRKYLERVLKSRIQCQTRVILGTLPTNTNCLTGRGDQALDKRLRKAEDQLSNVGGDCQNVNLTTLGFPGSCPDLSGTPFDTEDFKTCVVTSTNSIATTLLDYYYPPIRSFFRGSEAKCLNGSARDATRSILGSIKAREDCLLGQEFGIIANAVDCRKEIPPYGTGTGNAEVNEDIASAYVRLLGAIPAACAEVQIDDLNYQSACIDPTGGVFTIFDLKKCFFNVNRLNTILAINVPFPSDPVCGDGIKNGTEECDNGAGNSNTTPNACRTNCKNPSCGDSVKDNGETCDDGNTNPSDGCHLCSTGSCGDGIVQGTEQCDLGNESTPPPNNSNTLPNTCRLDCKNPRCGDTVEDTGEECDDGNTADCDLCSSLCFEETCGDNIVQACLNEECDDGVDNANAPNKCRTNCKNPTCPDGITDVISNGEDCDDGNTNDADACPNTCAFCGNNDKAQTEECDGTDNAACPGGAGCLDCECVDGICPTRGELVLYAGVGDECTTNTDCDVGFCDQSIGNCRTETRLDSGWNGAAHNADINNKVHVSGLLECPGHGPTCGLCSVTNVDTSTGNCRCGSLGDTDTPGQANQDICTTPFGGPTAECPQCENAATKNRAACANNEDCVDDSPRCSRNVRVCTNNNTKICTTNTDCGTGGTCPLRVCSNNGATACTNNTDCSGGTCASRKACSTTGSQQVCTADSECFIRTGTCTGQAECNCYFGAPFPLSSGGTPACVLNKFFEPISGTANVDLGSGSISANLRTTVYLGQTGVTNPCPTCGGRCTTNADDYCDQDQDCPNGGTCTNKDPIPNDGVRGGLCTAGQNKTLPCDVTAFNTTFPAYPIGQPAGGGYSLDCIPSTGKNISGTGLVIKLTQTTGTSTLAAEVSCQDSLNPDDECPCLVCSGNTFLPCNKDSECAAVGAGTCSSTGTGTTPQRNECNGKLCTAQPDGTGVCTTGPDLVFCEGIVRANGEGLIPCNGEAACLPPSTDFDVGPCSLVSRRLCFPDPIVATGTPSPTTPIGAATFCIPPTDNASINLAAGLPGPGRVVNQATAKTFCGIDEDKQYIPGVGGCFDDLE